MIINYSYQINGETGAKGIIIDPIHVFATESNRGISGFYIMIDREYLSNKIVLSFNYKENRDKVFQNIQDQIYAQTHATLPRTIKEMIPKKPANIDEILGTIREMLILTKEPNPNMTAQKIMRSLNQTLSENNMIKSTARLGILLSKAFGKDKLKIHKPDCRPQYYNLALSSAYIIMEDK